MMGFLVMLALFSVGLLAGAQWLQSMTRSEKEAELLFVGQQFRSAIESYRLAGGINQYPRRLEDLLQDPRLPTIKRHLRRIYPDPITGKSTWGVVKAPDGGILGVFSLSTQEPLKSQGFDAPDKDMEQRIQMKLQSKISDNSGQPLPFGQPGPAVSSPAMSTNLSQPMMTPTSPMAGLSQTTTDTQNNEPLPPDPPQYTYRDWKFIVTPNVVGTSGFRSGGGG
jgi:type II secretory pathway pseudopilin PulG